VLRTTPEWCMMKEEEYHYTNEDGKLLGRIGTEGVTPTLCFALGTERNIQEMLLAWMNGRAWPEVVELRKNGGPKVPHCIPLAHHFVEPLSIS